MGVKPFNYYDLTDTNKYELFDVIFYGAYPAFGYLFVYYLDYFNFKRIKLVLYFLSWALFSAVFELLLVRLHVYVYTGWKIVYSLPVYICVLSLTFLFYKFLIYYKNNNTDKQTNRAK
ncbi:hypothetical protein [Radiobacillus sp. PE A8.2]|uniref:hypothetical protein n=1 Tax=Radiobacillus sp. PE A8.2 TaxID=3380349 RepID=UPI003890EAAF